MHLVAGVHWGTVWTCVAALAAAVASIIALCMALVETRRRNADLERAAKRDAALLTITVDLDPPGTLWARLTNHGNSPVIDIDIVKAEAHAPDGRRGSILPGGRVQKRGGTPLSPGKTWVIDLAGSYTARDGSSHLVARGDQVVITYQYLDATGQLWEREANRTPRRLPQSEQL